jgi:hypothetical protein
LTLSLVVNIFTGIQGKLLEQLPSGEDPSFAIFLSGDKNHCISFLLVKRTTQKEECCAS